MTVERSRIPSPCRPSLGTLALVRRARRRRAAVRRARRRRSSGGSAAKGTPSAKAAALTEDEYQALLDDSARRREPRARRGPRRRQHARRPARPPRARRRPRWTRRPASSAPSRRPEAAAPANANAVSALETSRPRSRRRAGKVESGGLCTGPAALAQVTRSGAAGDLRSAAKSAARRTRRSGPKRQPFPALRLKSGSVLSQQGRRQRAGRAGHHATATRREGVVKLVAGGQRMSIYVGAQGDRARDGDPGRQLRGLLRQRRLLGRQAQHVHPQLRLHEVRPQDEVHVRRRAATCSSRSRSTPSRAATPPTRQIDPADFPRG